MGIEEQARFREVFEAVDRTSPVLDRMRQKAAQTGHQFSVLDATIRKLRGNLVAGIAGFTMRGLMRGTEEALTRINRLRENMGSTAAEAASMQRAFRHAGLDVGALDMAIGRWGMTVSRIQKMQAEGKRLPPLLAAWGGLGPAAIKSFPAAFAAIAQQVRNARSEQEKFVIVSKYFGVLSRRFTPILSRSPEEIRRMTSGGLAGALDDKTANKAQADLEKVRRLRSEWEDVRIRLGLAVWPMINRMTESVLPTVERITSAVEKVFANIAKHAETFVDVARTAIILWGSLRAFRFATGMIPGAWGAMGNFVAGTAAARMAPALASAVPAWAGGVGGAGAAAGGLGVGAAAGAGAAAGGGAHFFRMMKTGAMVKMLWPVLGAAVTGKLMHTMFQGANSAGQGLTDLSRLNSGKFVRGDDGTIISQVEDAKRYREHTSAMEADARALEQQEKAAELASGSNRALSIALRSVHDMAGFAEKDLKNFGFTLEGLAAQAKAGASALAGSLLLLRATGDTESTGNMHNQVVAYRRMVDVKRFEDRLKGSGLSAGDQADAAKRFNEFLLTKRYGRFDTGVPGMPGITVHPEGSVAPEIQAWRALKNKQAEEKELQGLLKELGLVKNETNFNGPIYVDIDARDQDPDKIMYSGIDALEQMAHRPVVSRMHQPFGGGK